MKKRSMLFFAIPIILAVVGLSLFSFAPVASGSPMAQVSSCVTSSGTSTPTPGGADPCEVNDSLAAATVIVPGVNVKNLTILTGDHDWFVATGLAKGQYRIQIVPAGSMPGAFNADLTYTVIPGGNGTPITYTLTDGNGGQHPDTYFTLDADNTTVQMDVYGANATVDYSQFGNYALVFTAVYTPNPPTATPTQIAIDKYEPNNTVDQAKQLIPDVTLSDLTLTTGDVDMFWANLGKGKYAISMSASNASVNPDLKIYYDGTLVYNITDNGGTILPALQIQLDKDTVVRFEISGARLDVDYSLYGRYGFNLAYIPQYAGFEDSLEPNNDEAHALASHYEATYNNLTIFSYSAPADQDWFKFYTPKPMDFHCQATASNGLLNLGFKAHLQDKTDMGGYKVDLYQDVYGANPIIVFHNIKGGETVYLDVYQENPENKNLVGAISYTLDCKGGVWSWPTTPTPAPTAAPTSIGGGGGGGGTVPTPLPSPTALPSSIPFSVSLLSSGVGQPTQPAMPVLKTVTFIAYIDYNGNSLYDPDEGIRGLTIHIYDTKTKKVIQKFTTKETGQISITLTGDPRQFRYIVPLLNLNSGFGTDPEIKIKAPKYDFGKIIP